jgi:hypothetical protein
MEAKELRIGNYVHYHIVDNLDERKEWYEVNEVDIDDIYTILIGKADDLSPIPLTEENLFNLGFSVYSVRKKYTIFCKNGDPNNRIHSTNNGFYYKIYNATKIIYYVHELQNLYFAKTGRELIFAKK